MDTLFSLLKTTQFIKHLMASTVCQELPWVCVDLRWIKQILALRSLWSVTTQFYCRKLRQHGGEKFIQVWDLEKMACILEKEMATHSSILAWRISWTEEPSGLQPIGPQRARHDWSDLAAGAAACVLGQRIVSSGSLKNSLPITAAAAKLLQSCPTLCDPIDSSPPGSSVPGLLPIILCFGFNIYRNERMQIRDNSG